MLRFISLQSKDPRRQTWKSNGSRRLTLEETLTYEDFPQITADGESNSKPYIETDQQIVEISLLKINDLPGFTAETREECEIWLQKLGISANLPKPRQFVEPLKDVHWYGERLGRAKLDFCSRGHDLNSPKGRMGKRQRCRQCHLDYVNITNRKMDQVWLNKHRAYKKEWNQKHKAEIREYNLKHRDKINAQRRARNLGGKTVLP